MSAADEDWRSTFRWGTAEMSQGRSIAKLRKPNKRIALLQKERCDGEATRWCGIPTTAPAIGIKWQQ
jgi:hypothetical protein